MNTNRVQYPKTMIVKYQHGKMQWVRDAGVVGAYQPMTTFDSCQVTHTENEARNIRLAYHAESASVVAIGDNTGITAVSPDFGDMPADFDEIMQGLAEWDAAQAEHHSAIGIY